MTLRRRDDQERWNRDGVWVYKELKGAGLIEGTAAMGGFVFDGVVTQRGFDWVDDYRKKVEDERANLRSNRAHDWRIALFGIIGGLFSGALGAWLYDIIVKVLS